MNRPSDSNDGPTVIRTGPTGGPVSDFAPTSTLWSDSLPEGLRLSEYEIRSVIGEGGFGIVYLAYDHFLQRQVALKEYMPSTLAGRARTGLDVVVKAERHRETFMAGLRSFVNEARLLAQFDHPALVKVYRFWEAHGTAYMVMPYCVGPTLKEALASHDGPPDEDWLRHHLLNPLLEALALLHKAQCLHRDIAPDNILLTDTGPLLLDFGAARQIIGDMSQTLTVVLKPGYAPIEQYGEVASMGQGAWTDLYALAGVVRYAITGKVPVAATSRILQDTLVPLTQLAGGQYSELFLRTIDDALAVRPADRPHNVAAFQARLEGIELAQAGSTQPDVVASGPSLRSVAGSVFSAGATPTTGRPRTTASPDPAARTGPRSWSPSTVSGQPATPAAAISQAKAPPGAGRGTVPWLIGGLILLSVAAGGWMFLQGQGAAAPAAADPEAVVQPKPPLAESSGPSSLTVPSAKAPASGVARQPATPQAAEAVATELRPTPASPAVSSVPVVQQPVSPQATASLVKAAPAVAPASPPAAVPALPRAAKPAPAEQAAALEVTPKRASPGPDRSVRCSDILQKASLEPLTVSEAAFLKSECR